MTDPTTVNVLLAIPSHASDVNAWDTPLNNDFTSIDGRLGGVASLSFAGATTVTLSKPMGTTAPAAGPTQAENAAIVLSGTLSGTSQITLPMPGYYLVQNNCTVGAANYIVMAPASGGGILVGLPPGRTSLIWTDGSTGIKTASEIEVGALLDVSGTAIPAWISASNPLPYVKCNGSTFNISTYPVLGNKIGSTFGGNGTSTFAVPNVTSQMGTNGTLLIRVA